MSGCDLTFAKVVTAVLSAGLGYIAYEIHGDLVDEEAANKAANVLAKSLWDSGFLNGMTDDQVYEYCEALAADAKEHNRKAENAHWDLVRKAGSVETVPMYKPMSDATGFMEPCAEPFNKYDEPYKGCVAGSAASGIMCMLLCCRKGNDAEEPETDEERMRRTARHGWMGRDAGTPWSVDVARAQTMDEAEGDSALDNRSAPDAMV